MPVKSTREALLHRQVLWNVSGAGPIEKEWYRQTRKNTINAMYNMMHDHDMAI